MKTIIATMLILVLFLSANAGSFSSKEGSVFQTKGSAKILKETTFTHGVERRDIPIPTVLDIRVGNDFNGLTHDRESGWTKCRVPQRSQLGITGIVTRTLVFDCKPLQYFR